jgi:hypothetical protein
MALICFGLIYRKFILNLAFKIKNSKSKITSLHKIPDPDLSPSPLDTSPAGSEEVCPLPG